jgi:hypothetical protein
LWRVTAVYSDCAAPVPKSTFKRTLRAHNLDFL